MLKFHKLSTFGSIQHKSTAGSEFHHLVPYWIRLFAAAPTSAACRKPKEAAVCQEQSTCFYAWERSGECCLEWTEQKKSVCHLLSSLHSAFLASVRRDKRNTEATELKYKT